MTLITTIGLSDALVKSLQDAGIETLEQLQLALDTGKLTEIPGVGSASEKIIRKNLSSRQNDAGPLASARLNARAVISAAVITGCFMSGVAFIGWGRPGKQVPVPITLEPPPGLNKESIAAEFRKEALSLVSEDGRNAIAKLHVAAELDASPRDFSNIGLITGTLGDLDGAQYWFSRGLSAFPKDRELQVNLGRTYGDRGEFDVAMKHWRSALTEPIADADRPIASAAHINIGKVYELQGHQESALTEFEKAREFDPDNAVSYLNKAVIYTKQDKFAKAVQEVSLARARTPDDVDTMLRVANVFFMFKHHKEAAEICEDVLVLDSDNETAHLYIGMAHFNYKRYPEAEAAFQKILDMNDWNPDGHYAMAALKERLREDGAPLACPRVVVRGL